MAARGWSAPQTAKKIGIPIVVLRAATVPCRSPALQVISYRTNSIRVPDLTLRKSTPFLYTTKKRAGNSPPFLIFAMSRLHFLFCRNLFCPKFGDTLIRWQ